MASEKKSQSTIDPPAHPYDPVKRKIADALAQACQALWGKDLTAAVAQLPGRLERPKDVTLGDLSLPTFSLIQYLKPAATAPPAIAAALAPALNERLAQLPEVEKVVAAGPYLNFYLTTAYLGGVVTAINDNNFLAKLPSAGRDRVMIEYSQPNTHKAFHVGHMRNAALGDFLVRAYEQCGFPVIAANYFGDEGAHVAKCLWYLKRFFFAKGKTLADLAPPLGETLGKFYQDAVTLLDMSCLTTFPYAGVYAAEVVSITPHPSEKAPKNWNVVQVKMGDSADKLFTVVCGGWGYNVGDKVAYVPVGVKFNKKVIAPMDKEGIQSHGIILARKELDLEDEKEEAPKAADQGKKGDKPKDASKDKPKDAPKDASKDKPKDAPKDASKDKPKDDKGKDKGKPAERPSPLNRIYVLPKEVPAGVNLPEFGRIPDPLEPHWKLPADRKIEDEIEERETEVRANLLALEHKDPEAVKLWETTKDMCIKEFKEIYAWLNVRFDHDFYESEMTEEAKRIVTDFLEKGVLVRDAGAVGADLKKHGLGFLVLLKSDGSTLYATKDLALARRKFEKFGIDKSIYVVDAAQSMHFSQVFKTLELFGYEQAKKCFHLPYGMVTLPSGRMSSRAGTIVYFNTLKNELAAKIQKDFLSQYEGKWQPAEIAQAVRAISLAAIKYGMLNTDSAKDIVFEMDGWTALKGNTGPYLMYAYTRMYKIIREVEPKAGAKLDFSCMTQPVERRMLSSLNEFWQVVWASATGYNSSPLCNYLFDLCKDFSSWYELPDSNVKNTADPNAQLTRLAFLKAVSQTLKTGLHILGLEVLDRM